jgi:hypothetical protein
MSEQIDLPVPGSGMMVAKRCFNGPRGMQSILHSASPNIWKAALLLFGASIAFSGLAGLSFSSLLAWPDRLSFLALPMFWIILAMPMNLLLQIVKGQRGLRGDLHFLSASLSAFAFFIPFSIGLALLPHALFAEETILMAGFGLFGFALMIGVAWASIQAYLCYHDLLGVSSGFSAIKAAGIQSLLVMTAIGLWAYFFPVWQGLDPFAFR